MIKALTDVVLPAVDPQNKLAQEQMRLAIGMLGLMAKQLPLQFRFDRDELMRLIAFSGELLGLVGSDAQSAELAANLASNLSRAKAVLERAKADPIELEQAVRDLRAGTGALVSQRCTRGDDPAAAPIEKAVLAMSRQQLLRDRSWLLSQGWEPDPAGVPAIETLLAP
jgi:hypothetical protein